MRDMNPVSISMMMEGLTAEMDFTVLAGMQGMGRLIGYERIQKTGLALAGLPHKIKAERIQVFGDNECSYLNTLSEYAQCQTILDVLSRGVPGIVLTRGMTPPEPLVRLCNEQNIPLLLTTQTSSQAIILLNKYLENHLAPTTTVHGVLVDVHGAGVLMLGKSGVGKSETALDLVLRGFRLVADDIVEVRRMYPRSIIGKAPEAIKHHMEIRGVGIIDVSMLFGVSATRSRKQIDLVLELVEWDPHAEYDRLGLEHHRFPILDVELPMLVIPVSQGRNMATIVELAARNHLLRMQGVDSAILFKDHLQQLISMPDLNSLSLTDETAATVIDGAEDEDEADKL